MDSKVAIWHCDRILQFQDDLEEIKANKVVKSKWRLTCLAINNLKDFKVATKKKKSKEKHKEAPKEAKEAKEKQKKKRDLKAERKLQQKLKNEPK